MHRIRRSTLVITALCLAVGTALAPAAAAGDDTATWFAGPAAAVDPHFALAGWSPDEAGDGLVKKVTVRAVECRADVDDGLVVGVGNAVPGFPLPIAAYGILCADGVATYPTLVASDLGFQEGTASVGDRLRLSVDFTDTGLVVRNENLTTGAVLEMTGELTAVPLHFGAFPAFDGPDPMPVPDFGKLRFVRAVSGGETLSPDAATRYHLVGDGVRIRTTGLSATGTFNLVFKAH